MVNYKRILFEVIIIVIVFTATNLSFGEGPGSGIGGGVLIPQKPIIAKKVDHVTADKLIFDYLHLAKEKQIKGAVFMPITGYSAKGMKLEAFDLPFKGVKGRYDPKFMNYVSQAIFRDSVVASNNELEERIRKLENTVNKIISQCCRQVKGY